MRVAILGMGLMGRALAMRLKAENVPLTCWNRSKERLAQAAYHGLPVSTELDRVVGVADFVILALSDAQAAEETLDRLPPEALQGKVLIQMGTIAPAESRALAIRTEQQGAEYLEAPVLGSVPEAKAGSLIVMAGGSQELFDHCRPLLQHFSSHPHLVGGVGAGAGVKLAMNQLIASLTTGFALSLGMVRAEGIDVPQFMAMLRDSALYAPTFDKKLSKYLAHHYGEANFPLQHLLKDVRLFETVAAGHGMDTGLVREMERLLVTAMGAGFAAQDYSAVYEAVNPSENERTE